MTDVRLTALNPEDSKVYPVACNSSGELITTKSGDINLDVPGDLTVGGNATFAGATQVGKAKTGGNLAFSVGADLGGGSYPVEFTAAGSAKFISGITIISPSAGSSGIQAFGAYGLGDATAAASILTDGSARFSGNKAGFTTEGNLWCTTVRGQTVILDATSNGLATWADYIPPKRRS